MEAERDERNFAITQDSQCIERATEFVEEAKVALTALVEMNAEGNDDRQQVEEIYNGARSYEDLLKRYGVNISGPPETVTSLEEEMYTVATNTINLMEDHKI